MELDTHGSKHDWGTPFETYGRGRKTFKFIFFFTFPMTYLKISFFFMSNEIILFQILYRLLEFYFFQL
jgi:hypothetical protein